MRKFIKKNAFWIVVDFVFLLYFAFLGLIFFAPRVDKLERGFIGCTKNLIEDIYQCREVGVWCSIKATLKNNICDFKVIKSGFVAWLNGKQKTPFANYYFEPVLEDEPDEELKALYQEHIDIFKDMEELNKKRIELERKLETQNEAIKEDTNGNKE